MWRTMAIMLLAVALVPIQANSETINYGRTDLFRVAMNDNGACVAARELPVRREGSLDRKGVFMFGVLLWEGEFKGLVSMINPSFAMATGQYVAGIVEIDKKNHDAIYVADSPTQLTAITSLDALVDVSSGRQLVFDTGHVRYTAPLTGTFKAMPLLMRCVKDLEKSKENPLGTPPASPRSVINPLTGDRL